MAKFWLLMLASSFCLATEVISVGIRTGFRYADLDHQCYLPPLAENFTLAAEMNETKMTRAILRKNFLSGYSQMIELDSNEMSNIVSYNKGDLWKLTSWTVSGRLLEMLLWGGTDQGVDTCFPPEPLTTMNPSQFTFQFSQTDSNKAVFQGITKSGKAYRIELSLSQDI